MLAQDLDNDSRLQHTITTSAMLVPSESLTACYDEQQVCFYQQQFSR